METSWAQVELYMKLKLLLESHKKTPVTHYLICDFHIKACRRTHKNVKLILNYSFLGLDEIKQVELNVEPCGVNKHHAVFLFFIFFQT